MDRLSSAPTDCRVPDPSDKLDAKADGQFQAVNRRAGYGDDRLDRIIATARKGWTLAAGEGLVLVQEIDRLRGELELVSSEAADAFNDRDAMEGMSRHHVAVALDAIAKLNHAQAILAALREPSEKVLLAAVEAVPYGASYAALTRCIPAAVAAAEKEVRHDEG